MVEASVFVAVGAAPGANVFSGIGVGTGPTGVLGTAAVFVVALDAVGAEECVGVMVSESVWMCDTLLDVDVV